MTDNGINWLPDSAVKTHEGLATSPEGKSWECPNCGTIPAKEVPLAGKIRYIKQLCPCEKERRAKAESEAMRQEMLAHCWNLAYTWLGNDFSDIPLKDKTFQNFNGDFMPGALDRVNTFMEMGSGSLVLYGSFGTGKTHLLAALVNEMINKRYTRCLFTTAPKLFAAIQKRIQGREMDKNAPDYSSILTAAIHTPLLVIDDVDKAKPSPFRSEIYFNIVNERINAGRPIALSTNRLNDLAYYLDNSDTERGAVCSRLKIGQIAVPMIGLDYREQLEA